ncbi:hypothetical protein GARC_1824 [Paraglaciecola arctica BSs20135]|uniref:Uncharacterized protein n=1 Tax=Paraglaciecola arctica BSs20135 TaxID=493475 RepID=K6YKX6_9ALTE|nr:hypothetical protein GARC_1824 [Paraglaciecola arctica BSs20135]
MLVKYCYLTGLLVLFTKLLFTIVIQFTGQHHGLTKLLILKKY